MKKRDIGEEILQGIRELKEEMAEWERASDEALSNFEDMIEKPKAPEDKDSGAND
jgi:hypothetical protein